MCSSFKDEIEYDEVRVFIPPCCPNPECEYHVLPKDGFPDGSIWYVHRGVKRSVQQFVCKGCSRCFSESTFQLSYYEKVRLDYDEILAACDEKITLESWSFKLQTSAPTLKIRLHKLLWMLCRQLEEKIEADKGGGAFWEAVDLLAEASAIYVKRKGWVYPLLRDLIFRFKSLLMGSCDLGGVSGADEGGESGGDSAGDEGRTVEGEMEGAATLAGRGVDWEKRLLIHDLKQNVLQILRRLLGHWHYRLAGTAKGRFDWYPFHATE